jgi:DNA-binding transcriptional LysR family regulator
LRREVASREQDQGKTDDDSERRAAIRHQKGYPERVEQSPVKYLYFSEASALGQIVDAMLARHEEPVFVKKSSSSPLAGALKSMAESGLGVTWFAGMLARIGIRDGSLVQAGDDSWCIPVEIRMFRSRGRLPPVAENFWRCVAAVEDAS